MAIDYADFHATLTLDSKVNPIVIRSDLLDRCLESGRCAYSMIYRVHSLECVFAGTCEVAMGVLKDNRLIIAKEGEKEKNFCSTAYGRLVAKYFISVESMRILYQVN